MSTTPNTPLVNHQDGRDYNATSGSIRHRSISRRRASTVSEIDAMRQSLHLPPPTAIVNHIFFLLGAALLVPWNAMITATPYFVGRMGDTALRSTFASYLVSSCQVCRFPALIHATITANHVPKTPRIRWAGSILALLLASLAASTYFNSTPKGYFAFAIINAVLQSIAGSYMSTSVMGLASFFGPLSMQSVMSGQAAVAVVISILQLISALVTLSHEKKKDQPQEGNIIALPQSVDTTATVFFNITTLIMLFAIFAHWRLTRMPVYKSVVGVFEAHKANDVEEEQAFLDDSDAETHELDPALPVSVPEVAKKNAHYNIAILFNFLITLAVFPAITSAIRSVNKHDGFILTNTLIFSALHFLTFNSGDWIGRWLCRFSVFQVWAPRYLLILSFGRIIFIPLFLACNLSTAATSGDHRDPFIDSDVAFFVILLLFGISNGHVGSSCMMAAPSLEHNPKLRKEEVDTAAVVASFCLSGGLLLGSVANFAVRATICQCNPFIS